MKKQLTGIILMLLLLAGCKKERSNFYNVDETKSSITWIGASPETQNTGTFSPRGKNLRFQGGKMIDGSFDIPINSLNVTNLPPDLKPVLTTHLLSPDFFNVATHPLATFKIRKTEVYANTTKPGEIENANILITGDLSMIGVTKSVTFPARIEVRGNSLQAEAKLEIDRTKWGMNYAADPALGEHHIYPMVKLHIKLNAIKK